MINATWAVVPRLRRECGGLRQNPLPYFYADSCSFTALANAQSVKRALVARGVACYVELIEN